MKSFEELMTLSPTSPYGVYTYYCDNLGDHIQTLALLQQAGLQLAVCSNKPSRFTRELLDLRYSVGRQQTIASIPGKPANVDFYSSTMKVDIALLHEGDLLGFLRDLRESGNAFYSVRRCAITRTGIAATGTSIVPRLRAECEIDLITIIDRAAKA